MTPSLTMADIAERSIEGIDMGKHSKDSGRAQQTEQATKAALDQGDDPKELASWKGGHVGRGVSERGGENARDMER